MDIIIAKHGGFCFGVDRAIKIVYNEIDKSKKIATLGTIIHNADVVNDLKNHNVRVVETIEELSQDETLILRSHGVPNDVYQKLEIQGNPYIDATCPFVAKIHKIVKEKSQNGYIVLIAGDKSHVEVQGIIGHCVNENVHCFESSQELENLLKSYETSKIAIVSQTTFNTKIWKSCMDILEKYPNVEVFNTICNATSIRQSESIEIAKKCDIMLIVGGKDSSNTKKLYTICSEKCPKSYHIENSKDLKNIDFSNAKNIGITAGASTPSYIIEDIKSFLEDI